MLYNLTEIISPLTFVTREGVGKHYSSDILFDIYLFTFSCFQNLGRGTSD